MASGRPRRHWRAPARPGRWDRDAAALACSSLGLQQLRPPRLGRRAAAARHRPCSARRRCCRVWARCGPCRCRFGRLTQPLVAAAILKRATGSTWRRRRARGGRGRRGVACRVLSSCPRRGAGWPARVGPAGRRPSGGERRQRTSTGARACLTRLTPPCARRLHTAPQTVTALLRAPLAAGLVREVSGRERFHAFTARRASIGRPARRPAFHEPGQRRRRGLAQV